MTTDLNTFSFVAESLGGVFDFLSSLTDDHHVQHVCIRDFSGIQLVHVTTDAHIDCVFDAMFATDDDLMLPSLRHLGRIEDGPE